MFIANTKKQDLTHHCVVVGKLAAALYKSFNFSLNSLEIDSQPIDEEELVRAIQMGAQDGDIGKAVEPNQKYFRSLLIAKENYNADMGESTADFISNNPLHHEISYILALQKAERFSSPVCREAYIYAVYWHHAKPIREVNDIWEKIWNLIADNKEQLTSFFESDPLLNFNANLDESELKTYKTVLKHPTGPQFKNRIDQRDIDQLRSMDNPKQELSNITQKAYYANTINSISRLMAIIADRTISKLTAEEVSDLYCGKTPIKSLIHCADNQHIVDSIEHYLLEYKGSERSLRQEEAAINLSMSDSRVCNGAPGSGKTRIALSAYAKRQEPGKAKKLFWICPRIDVCLNVADELKSILPKLRIQVHTGEHKYTYCHGQKVNGLGDFDIKITTIDQACNKLLKHGKADEMLEYLNASIVYDEFHEIITDPGFISYFYELIWIKTLQKGRDFTLISGTVAPMHLSIMGDFFENGIVGCKTFNENKINYSYKNQPELNKAVIESKTGNWIMFQNKVLDVQKSYIDHLSGGRSDCLIYHSKLNAVDRQFLFNKITSSFGSKNNTSDYEILHAGPAAKASLNISRQNLISEVSDPETMSQQLGRRDRFAQYDIGESIRLLGEARLDKNTKIWKIKDGTLSGNNQAYIAFYHFLWMRYKLDGVTSDLAHYNDLYAEFYNIWAGKSNPQRDIELASAITTWSMERMFISLGILISYENIREFATEAVNKSIGLIGKIKTDCLGDVLDKYIVCTDRRKRSRILKLICDPNLALEEFKQAFKIDLIGFVEKISKIDIYEPKKSLTLVDGQIAGKVNLRDGNTVYANAVKSTWQISDISLVDTTSYIGEVGDKETLFKIDVDELYESIGHHLHRLRAMDPDKYKEIVSISKFGKKQSSIEEVARWKAEDPDWPIYASILSLEGMNSFEPINYLISKNNIEEIPVGYFFCNKL